LGALDTLVVVMLAALVARRFRDIGWRGWIGASFMIATMVVAPLALIAYAIANSLRPAQFMEVANELGWIVAAANLVLLVVSGSVRGSGALDPIPAGPAIDALQPAAAARSPSAAQDEHRVPNVLAASAGIMVLGVGVIVLVAAIGGALLASRDDATSASSAPSAGQRSGAQPIRQARPVVQNWLPESASSAPSAGQPPGVQPNGEPRPGVQNWILESERNRRSR
jgi:hypothetical protein